MQQLYKHAHAVIISALAHFKRCYVRSEKILPHIIVILNFVIITGTTRRRHHNKETIDRFNGSAVLS